MHPHSLLHSTDPRHERGSVIVEYTVLLVTVSLMAILAIASLGTPLMQWYLAQRTFLLLGLP